MWKRNLVLVGAIGLIIASVYGPAASQENTQQPSPEEMQKAMEEWLKSMKPGAAHDKLEFFVGEWDTITKVYWAGPDAPAMESKGSSSAKWILGKRHVESSHKGVMMMPDPKTGAMTNVPYEGRGTFGYDNVRNLYIGSWMDNMSTYMLTFKGTAAPDGKTIRLYGEMDEPMLNMYGRTVKYSYTIKDADTYVFEIVDLAAGDNYKVIEIINKRKK